MYASFSLKIDAGYFSAGASSGTLLQLASERFATEDKRKKDAASSLEYLRKRLAPADSIKASDIIDGWFSARNNDVFISHSHKDIDLATALASWLKTHFDLTSFIDSAVWGHARELLREVDDQHCRNDDGRTYNYDKRNGTTSHVYLMLANALTTMIDSCECLIFLNTPSSLSAGQAAADAATYSPWIFTELSAAEVIRRRSLSYYRRVKTATAGKDRILLERREFTPIYDVSKQLRHTKQIGPSELNQWKKSNASDKNSRHPLDVFYSLFADEETK